MATACGLSEHEIEVHLVLRFAAMGARDATAMTARAHAFAARAASSLLARGLLLAYTISEPRLVEKPKYRSREEIAA